MSSLLEHLRAARAPEYDVEYELATGGMGTVFRGRDTGLDGSVPSVADARALREKCPR